MCELKRRKRKGKKRTKKNKTREINEVNKGSERMREEIEKMWYEIYREI